MFGLTFLFTGALLALPLAATPVILHLLFRRKSRVVPFSTLRFIRASVQRTAARKRIQQWLLLACRVLLLGLLIWAIAQPARQFASRWMSHGSAPVAAIVIDNSYSMLLQHDHVTRLDQANDAIQDLLRNELREAQVAIFKSQPSPDGKAETLQSAAAVLEQLSPLKPSPAPQPLADRVGVAMAMLDAQHATDKWLIVISDLQSREFPRPLPAFDGGRFMLLDLHPDDPRSVGISAVALDPPQAVAGVPADAVVDVVGKTGDTRACNVSLLDLDGHASFSSAPSMAALDAGGRIQLRFPVKLPAEQFVQVKAALSGDDDLTWDDSRTLLIGIPPRQTVRVIQSTPTTPADRAIALALDPTEGQDASWPLDVHSGALVPTDHAAVAVISQWPGEAEANQLLQLARSGGSVVLCLRPGLEQSWKALSAADQSTLGELLPAPPVVQTTMTGSIVITSDHDPLLTGLTDAKGVFPAAHVREMVPIPVDAAGQMVLGVAAENASGHPQGLLYRRTVGRGVAYTLCTLPDAMDSNLATNPAFLPLLVRMCLPPAGSGNAKNIELGQPVIYDAPSGSPKSMSLQAPDGAAYSIPANNTPDGVQFRFDQASQPGLYIWRTPGKADPAAVTNVQLPAAESELVYRKADQVTGGGSNVVIARSLAELRSKSAQVAEPEPHWSGPIAIVLLLICLESLMASTKGLWKPMLPGRFRRVPSGAAAN
ncbi:MAG: BatA domain-containing protein [Phycisphaerae bacterium]|nr:BatA domain-containing protein [Phycisphaerae bacterium]